MSKMFKKSDLIGCSQNHVKCFFDSKCLILWQLSNEGLLIVVDMLYVSVEFS